MLPSEVWTNAVDYIRQTLPQCEVRRQYAPTDEYEALADYDRPTLWVALDAIDSETVTSNAAVIGDSYTLSITILWRVRSNNSSMELDGKLDALQDLLTPLRHCIAETPAGCLFFGVPTITTAYDMDLLTTKSIFAAEASVSVTSYRDRYAQMTVEADNTDVTSQNTEP